MAFAPLPVATTTTVLRQVPISSVSRRRYKEKSSLSVRSRAAPAIRTVTQVKFAPTSSLRLGVCWLVCNRTSKRRLVRCARRTATASPTFVIPSPTSACLLALVEKTSHVRLSTLVSWRPTGPIRSISACRFPTLAKRMAPAIPVRFVCTRSTPPLENRVKPVGLLSVTESWVTSVTPQRPRLSVLQDSAIQAPSVAVSSVRGLRTAQPILTVAPA